MPKGDRGYQRTNRATRKIYDTKYQGNREFRGVDGEGGDMPSPGGARHEYMTLRCGENLLDTGKPLRYDDCFTFLTMQTRSRIDVAYFFDYDVTMMLRTMPEERVRRLLNRPARTMANGRTMPVDFEGFQIDYLPHKEFAVRDTTQEGKAHWFRVNDVGTFFQTSFLKSLDKWNVGTSVEREHIAIGKSKRGSFEFTLADKAQIEAYNALECLLLEQLMSDFRAACEAVGYVPTKWQGPGNLASAMLAKHGIPRRDQLAIHDSVLSLAQEAYYGGRFETTAVGPVDQPVFQYDINSAYPTMLKKLPCLSCGSWKLIRGEMPKYGLYMADVFFTHEPNRMLYNLPVRRKDGSIYFPREASGVYWSWELEAAQAAGTYLRFVQGWKYIPSGDCPHKWFDFVDNVYAERQRIGKADKGYVLKLALNSLYGKLAQSIGYAPYANPIWAGLITAGTRAELINAYSQLARFDNFRGERCLMLATDGIFSTSKLPGLELGTGLGQWELTEHPDGIFLIQPGFYYTGEDSKTRGINKWRIENLREQFEYAFIAMVEGTTGDPSVSIDVDNFITAKQALARNKWETAGSWDHDTREVSFDWSNKREPGQLFRMTAGEGPWRTKPQDGGPDVRSVGYDQIIGGGMIMGDERYKLPGYALTEHDAYQPDWRELPFPEHQ